MKSRDAQIRMKRFQIEERRRQVGQIETMIEEFGRMIYDLDMEIAAEHRRTGIEDEKHFAYSTFARAARQRRANLQTSVSRPELAARHRQGGARPRAGRAREGRREARAGVRPRYVPARRPRRKLAASPYVNAKADRRS